MALSHTDQIDVTGHNGSDAGLKLGDTLVTATAAEINALAGGGGTVFKKITQTVAYAAFTDGGGAVGTYTLTAGTIPVGAWVICTLVTAITGFTGDTTAVLTIGDGSAADRYNTGTVDVFATAAAGLSAGAPSGVQYHAVAKSIVLTVTKGSDWGAGTTGSVTIELYYLT